jgi:hypothetical protein
MAQTLTKVVLINLEENVIAGLAKLAPEVSLPVGGKLVTSKDLQAQLQAHVDTMNSANGARAKFSELVGVDKSQRAGTKPVLAAVRSYAAGLFGENSAEFASFGFKPTKVAQRTPLSKVEASEKVRATRIARHTMGKVQRSAIHGVVPTTPPPNGPVASAPATAAPVVSMPVAQPPIIAAPVSPAPIATPPVNAGANAVPTASVVMNGAAH